MTEREVSSERVSALPPVDGLEVVAFRHPESDWAHVQYSEIDMHCGKDGPRPIPLVTLPQAASVIAGLRSERITAERDALDAYGKLQTAEARISSLEEENKRLREALGKLTHLYESDFDPEVTARPDWLVSALEDHNG